MDYSEYDPDDSFYWATSPREELASAINHQIDRFLNDLELSGRLDVWRRAIRLYFGYDAEGGWTNSAALSFGGDNGETVMLRSNQFRSLLRSMIAMTTGTRPSFVARPKTADTHAQAEARLSESILDYYISDYGLEDDSVLAAIYALLLGEGWIEVRWDVNGGDPFDVEELVMPGQEDIIAENKQMMSEHSREMLEFEAQAQMGEMDMSSEPPPQPEYSDVESYEKIRYSGDIAFKALKPEDVARDIYAEDLSDLQWVIVRGLRSRWDLIAQFPEFAEEIKNAVPNANRERLRARVRRVKRADGARRDLVDVYELWHKSCDALPRGRYALMIDETVLIETPMPYEDLPVHPMVPSMEIDEPYGYGESWDLMALQQAYDATMNTIVSNHAAFGLQNIWAPPGSNLELKDLGGGLKHVESLHKPEPINLLPANTISIQMMESIQQQMQLISGINDVARGQADASQSGSALAMMASISVQYNSSLQRAYGQMWERVGTAVIRIFQRWATIPRTIEVAGPQMIAAIREVSGEKIERVSSITVDLGNPLMRTSAGKKEVADKLLQAKAITDPETYLQVQATGRLDPILNRARSQITLISSENERIMQDEPVKALITDDHAQHIAEHTVLLNDPGTRYDDKIVQATDLHIREHTMLWAQASPVILAATGQQPAPVMPPPGGAPAVPQEGSPGPDGGGGPPAQPEQDGLSGGPNAGKDPMGPQMPKMPTNGERVEPGMGGIG